MRKKKSPAESAEPRIVTVRGQRVILDADLAEMYGVEVRALNQAVKRNAERFPSDFVFQCTAEEAEGLKSQFVISSLPEGAGEETAANSSPSVTNLHGGRRKLPWVFTEHGALMAANILRSPRAVEMSVYVVRAFIRQREQLATSAEILRKLELIDHRLLEHDQALVIVWEKIKELMRPAPPLAPKPKPRIGFKP